MNPTILHVTALFGGGVDRHLRDIAHSVPGRHLVWAAGDAGETVTLPGSPPFALDRARLAGGLVAALRQAGIGLVHLHASALPARQRASAFAGDLGVPLVVTLHDVLFLGPDAFDQAETVPDAAYLAETAKVLRSAAAVLAPSAFIADLAVRHIPGLEVAVVPNGSAPSASAAPLEARAAFQRERPAHVVAVVGAIGPHKGAGLLEDLAPQLPPDTALVVIGYLDRQLHPGWRIPGKLFVHGAFDDAAVPALLAAYGAKLVLFPNRAPESFSYTLSDVWAAGVPVLAAPSGALGERLRAHGGGWLLPEGFGPREVAEAIARHLSAEEAQEVQRVRSRLAQPDPGRNPPLDAMARTLEALYRRFALDPSSADPQDTEALAALAAANLDGTLFRQELVRLADEYAQAQEALRDTRAEAAAFEAKAHAWQAKLERDVAELQAAVQARLEERGQLNDRVEALEAVRAAFDLLPAIVRRLLLRKVHARR